MKLSNLVTCIVCIVAPVAIDAASIGFKTGTLTVVTGAAPTTSVSVSTASFPGDLGGSLTAIKYLKLTNFAAATVNGCNGTAGGAVICAFQWDFTGVQKNGANTAAGIYGYIGYAAPDTNDIGLFGNAAGGVGVSATPTLTHSATTTGVMTIFQKIVYTTAINIATATNQNVWLFTGTTTKANTPFIPQCGLTVKQSVTIDGNAITTMQTATNAGVSTLTCDCKIATAAINTANTELTLTMDITGFGADPASIGIMFKQRSSTLAASVTAVTTLAQTGAITETALTTAASVSYNWDSAAATTTDLFDKFTYMVFQGAGSKGTLATTAALKLAIPATKTNTVWPAFETACSAGYVYVVPYCFDTARTTPLGGVPASTASNPKMLSTVEPVPVKVAGCQASSGAAGGPAVWVSMFVLMNLVTASFS